MAVPPTRPRKHPKAYLLSHSGSEWKVSVGERVYWVMLLDAKITVGRCDKLPIDNHWFGVFAALKRVTTGPDSAWEMIIPTEEGMRDDLNHYHFTLLVEAEAAGVSGFTRNVSWENESWKEEYE